MRLRMPILSSHKVQRLTRFANASSRLFYILLIVAGVFLLGGFLRFATEVNQFAQMPASAKNHSADGIVVLTGDEARIDSALNLLDAGNAKRLLISGVFPATSDLAISSRFPKHTSLFDCCVDFDRLAKNTAQNGMETAKWMKEQNFKSLIVVTSDYHLPRSLLEMSRIMPDAKIVPFAAVSKHSTHYANAGGLGWVKILAREYFKTLGASLKFGSM